MPAETDVIGDRLQHFPVWIGQGQNHMIEIGRFVAPWPDIGEDKFRACTPSSFTTRSWGRSVSQTSGKGIRSRHHIPENPANALRADHPGGGARYPGSAPMQNRAEAVFTAGSGKLHRAWHPLSAGPRRGIRHRPGAHRHLRRFSRRKYRPDGLPSPATTRLWRAASAATPGIPAGCRQRPAALHGATC